MKQRDSSSWLSRYNVRNPVGEADEKQCSSRADRLAKGENKRFRRASFERNSNDAELCLGEPRSEKSTKSTSFRESNDPTWMSGLEAGRRDWGLEKPKMLRQGWHEQSS